jgi:hypothetical protein
MLLIIICFFFCCWGPKLVLNVMKKHQVPVLQTESAFYISLVLSLLPYTQSCVNPVIYGFMSSKFRQSLIRSCCCCGCCRSSFADSRQRAVTLNGDSRLRINRQLETRTSNVSEF